MYTLKNINELTVEQFDELANRSRVNNKYYNNVFNELYAAGPDTLVGNIELARSVQRDLIRIMVTINDYEQTYNC